MTHLIRRALLRLAPLLCFAACAAHAVTLGPIDTQSALSEKFQAEIVVSSLGAVGRSQLRASLASAEDFERLGVERFFYLSDLQFEVTPRGRELVIEITSSQQITEPYLDFVVELTWRGGRVLRSYTVFLDPPGRVATAIASPEMEARQTPQTSQTAGSAAQDGRSYGPTSATDTLWSIARKTRENPEISVYQQMMSIKRLNPQAFVDNNINQLLRGQMLLLPTAAEAQTISNNEAARQAQTDDSTWQAQRELELQGGNAPTQPSAAGRLRIVSDPTSVTKAVPQAALDVASAGADTARNTVDGSTKPAVNQLAPLQNRVAALDQAIEVQNQELAALQLQIQEVQSALATLKAAAPLQTAPAPADGFFQNWLLPLLWAGLFIAVLLWLLRQSGLRWQTLAPASAGRSATASGLG